LVDEHAEHYTPEHKKEQETWAAELRKFRQEIIQERDQLKQAALYAWKPFRAWLKRRESMVHSAEWERRVRSLHTSFDEAAVVFHVKALQDVQGIFTRIPDHIKNDDPMLHETFQQVVSRVHLEEDRIRHDFTASRVRFEEQPAHWTQPHSHHVRFQCSRCGDKYTFQTLFELLPADKRPDTSDAKLWEDLEVEEFITGYTAWIASQNITCPKCGISDFHEIVTQEVGLSTNLLSELRDEL